MSAQSVVTSAPVEVRVISDTTSNELDNEYPDAKPSPSNFLNSRGNESSGTRQRRKARSTRRRLNAMINNTSLHFSDTDSEGELAVPRAIAPNGLINKVVGGAIAGGPASLLQPVISVTLDGSGDSSSSRRGSFIENLTDVDEIYPSDSEADGVRNRSRRASLAVNTGGVVQGETDLEDISNDDEDGVADAPIYVKPRNDILVDFNGETITTKEGDGPFSVEIRNQMSIDDPRQDPDAAAAAAANAPDITVVPTTDSEDMEASDDDDDLQGACGLPTYEDLDILAASQIVVSSKKEQPQQLLTVAEPDDGASEDSSFILQDITASPAPEKKTYPEKRRFWEDMAKSKRESFQRSESEVSHTSQLTYHDSDSECLSEVRERTEEEIAAEKLAEMNKSVDVSQFTVAEKAHYFEEVIQKETTAARNSIISQSSQESGKAGGIRLSGISFSSEDEKDTLDRVGKSQEKTIQELKKHIAETAESKVIVQKEEKTKETKEIKMDEKKVEKIEMKKSEVKETKKEIKKEDEKDKKKEEKKDESKEHDEKQKSKDEKKTEQKDSKSEIKAEPPKKEKKESFLSKAFFGRKSVDKDEKKDEPKKSFFGRKKEDKASKSDAKKAAEKESKLKEDIKTAKTEHEKKENIIKAKEQKAADIVKTESSVLKKETVSKGGDNLSTGKTDTEKESKAKETKMQENVEKKLQEAKEELRVSMSEIKKDESIENKHKETVTQITEELDKDKSTEKKLQDAETEKSKIDAPKTDLPEKIVQETESHVSETKAKTEKLIEGKSLDSEIKTDVTHLSKDESEKQEKSEEKSKNKIAESTPSKEKLKQETSSKPIPIQQKSKDENLSKSPPKKGTMSKSPPKKDLVSRSPPSKDRPQDLLSKSPPKKDKPKEVKLSKSPPKTEKFSPKSEKSKNVMGLEGKSEKIEKTPDKKKTETISTKEKKVEEKVDINLDKLKTEGEKTLIAATSSVKSETITTATKVDSVVISKSSVEKTSEVKSIKSIEKTEELKDASSKKDQIPIVPDVSAATGKVDPNVSKDASVKKDLGKEVIPTNNSSSTSQTLEKVGDVDVQKLNLQDTAKKAENLISEVQTNIAAVDSFVHSSMKEDHSRISPPKDLNIGMKSQDKDISSDFSSSQEIKRPTSMTIPLDSRPIMAVSSKPKDRSITSMPSTMITRDFGSPSISRSKQASPPKNKKPQVQDKKITKDKPKDKPKDTKAATTSKNEKEPEKPTAVKKEQSKEEIPIKTSSKSDKAPVKADVLKSTLLKKEKSKEDLPEKTTTKTDKITSKDDVSKILTTKKEKSKEEISVKTPAKTPVKETAVPGAKKQSEAKTIHPVKSKSPPKGSPPKSSPPKSSPPKSTPPKSSPPKSSPPKSSPPKSSPPKSSPPKVDVSKSSLSTTVKRESSKDEISKSMIPKKEKSKDEFSLKSPPGKTKTDDTGTIFVKREASKGEIPKSMIPTREKSEDEISLKSPPSKTKTDEAGSISVKRETSKGEIPKSMIPTREKSKDEISLKSPPSKTKTDEAGSIYVKRETSKGEIPKSMIPTREKSKDEFNVKSLASKTVSSVTSSSVTQEPLDIGLTKSSQEHEKSEESPILSLQRETSKGAIPKSMIPKREKSKDEFVSKIDVADKKSLNIAATTTTITTASVSVKDETQTKVEVKNDQILDPSKLLKDNAKLIDSKLSTVEQTSKILSSSPETIDQKFKDSPLALKRPDLKDPRSSEVSISSDDDRSLRDFEEIERLIEEKGKNEPLQVSTLSKAPSGPGLLKHDALSSVRLSGVSLSSDDERSLKDFEETERLLNEKIKQESSDLSDHSISSAKDKLKIESTSSPLLRRDDLATARSSELCFSSDEERSLRDFEETERLIKEKAKKMSFIPVREKSKEEIILKREKSKGEIPKSAVPKREKSKEEFSMKRETSRGEIPKSSIPKREKSKEEFSMKRETSMGEIPKSAIPRREKSKEEFSVKRETSKGEIPKSMIPKRESSKGEIPKSMIPKRESSKGEIPKSMLPKREASKGEIPKSMIPKRENSKDEFSIERETSKSEIPKSMIPKREKSGDEFNLKHDSSSSDSSKAAESLKRETSKGEIPKSMIPRREPSKEEIPKSMIPKREKSKDEIGLKRESSKSEIPKSLIPKREKSKDEIAIKREASKGEIPKSSIPKRESSKGEIPKSSIPKREKSKDEIAIKREASKGEIPKTSIPKRESSKSEIPKSSIPKREKSKDEIGVKRESSKSEIPKSTIPKREKSKDEIGVKRESSKSEIPKSTIPKREKSKDEIGVKREASKGEITKTKSRFDSPTASSMAKHDKSKEETPKKLSTREKSKEEIPKKLPTREKSKDDLPSSKLIAKRRDSKEDSSKPSPKTPSKSTISSTRRDSKEDSPKSVPKRPTSSRDSSRSSSLSISDNTSSPKTSIKSVKKESDSSSSTSTSVDTKKQAVKDSIASGSKEALTLSTDTSALSSTELLSFDTAKQISDVKLTSQIVSGAQKLLDTQFGTTSIETIGSTTVITSSATQDKFGDTFDSMKSGAREPKFSESEILNSGSSLLDDTTTTDLSSTRDSISFSLSGDILTRDESSLSSQVIQAPLSTTAAAAAPPPPPAAVVDGKFVSSLSGARVLEILEPDQDGQSRQDSMDISSSIEVDDWKLTSAESRKIAGGNATTMHESPAVGSLDRLDREFNANSPTFSEGTNVDYSLPQDVNNTRLDSGLERLVIRKKTDSFELESPPLVSPRLKVKELEIKPVEWILGEEKLEVKEHLEPSQAFDKELDEYQSLLAQQQQQQGTEADAKSTTKPRFTIVPAAEPDFEIEKELVENKLDISCQELMDTLQREYEAKTPTDDRLEEMAARSFNFSMTDEDLEREKFKVEGHKVAVVGGDLIKTAVNVIESERFVRLQESGGGGDSPMVQLREEQYDSSMQQSDDPTKTTTKAARTEPPREGKFDAKAKSLEEQKRAEKRDKSSSFHQATSPKTKKEDSKSGSGGGVVDLSSRYAITVLDQVVKKEIAEVKENLEAAKQDLIEELSAETGENVVGQIQDSPSEFQLVGLQPESIPNELPFLYKAPSSERVSESENFSTTSSSSPVAKPRRLSRGDGSSTESSSETKKIGGTEVGAASSTRIATSASEAISITLDKGKDSSGGDSSISVTSPVAASRSSSDEATAPPPAAAAAQKDDHSSFSLQPPQPAPRRQKQQQPTSESEADLSSSESNYQSLDYDRSHGSRPLSADVDATMIQSSSEYETAMLSFEHSSSKATSRDYLTAAQTLSSKDSMRSATSVSSGQFCSLDSASEISETLMADEPELDKDDIDENLENILDDDDAVQQVATTAAAAVVAGKPAPVGTVEASVPSLMKRSSEMIFTELISQVSSNKGTVESTKTAASIPAETDSAKNARKEVSLQKDNPLETTNQIIDLILARVEDTANKKSSSSLITTTSSSEPLDSLNILSTKSHDPYSFEPDSLEIKPQQQQQQPKLSSSVEDNNIMSSSVTSDSGLTLQQQLSMTSSSMSGVSLETVIEKEIDNKSDSDSFELVDKPDLIDDFVVVEEVGREAEEFDSEGKGIRISSMQYTSNKNFDRDVENLVIDKKDTKTSGSQARSSSSSSSRGVTTQEQQLFDFDAEDQVESPPQVSGGEDQDYSQSYSDEDQYQEGSKKWVEMQFQQNEARLYEMEYERGGPLEDIKEEEIADFDASSRLGSLGKESIGSVGSMRAGSFGSTPDNFESLAAKRLFKDHDNLSLSSLQEFEHLETAVALENVNKRRGGGAGGDQQQLSSGSQGSSASNGSLPRRYHSSRSEHDDASVSSVRDFESLEAACRDAHQIELRAREEEDLLDNESPENRFKLEKLARIIKAEGGQEAGGSAAGSFNPSTSGSDDYEKRIQEIDDIIRMAKENVQHIDELRQAGDDGTVTMTTTQQWSSVTTMSSGAGSSVTVVHAAAGVSSSSMTTTTTTTTQQVQVLSPGASSQKASSRGSTELNLMETSTDSLEGTGTQNYQSIMCRSSDSLELQKTFNQPSLSSDSLNNVKSPSREGEKRLSSSRVSSDSLEFPVQDSQDSSLGGKDKSSASES
ncbi:hypothetical protein TKK_0004111 [Trichogramma kaykai]